MIDFPLYQKDKFIVFGAPAIEEAEVQEVVDSMRTGWLGTGPKVAKFEEDFCRYKEVKHVVAVSSCTAALHLSLLAAGIKPGDEVITTPLTFCATVNAIIYTGAIPVLADIDPRTMNIDPAVVRAKITSSTRAIIPVHFAGRPCEMDALCEMVGNHDLKLIEDCAHAVEAEYKGRKTGTFGDFGCFSFYANKNLVTGEGGMVIAKEAEKAEYIKVLAQNGMSSNAWRRFHERSYEPSHVLELGFKYNMMDIQAAMGIHQLKRIENNWRRRREIWLYYCKGLSDLPMILPSIPEPYTRHAYHLFTVLIDESEIGINRDAFIHTMRANHVGVGLHYLSIPEHPYYQKTFGWKPEDYPNAMRIGRQTVSMPISGKLSDDEVEMTVIAVRKVIKQVGNRKGDEIFRRT